MFPLILTCVDREILLDYKVWYRTAGNTLIALASRCWAAPA